MGVCGAPGLQGRGRLRHVATSEEAWAVVEVASWYDESRMAGSMVTKAAGISRNALINYEAHGAVSPARDENGYRSYSRGDLLDVMCCTMLTSMGYSVAEAAEMLQGDEVMGVGHIDGYIERLARQRDAIQAKIENLAELREATLEARTAGEATFEAVECPEWLFFFDEHESVDIRDVKSDNQVALLRSVPLSCRGFTLEGFFDEGGLRAFYWARTLRRSHEHLLDVDSSRACVLGGACVRTVLRADYPDLDPEGTLRGRLSSYLGGKGLRAVGDPFVPLLLNNRRPSPIFELFVPVGEAG